ncbi:MAG: Mobile element protein [Brockia lithotrophica]|uniref:Mobile element protein n=1 Tax=Brockia lithotrophica TaxID=933949 RepID=A0A2T5G5Y5_9BACL|nr:MAG: Mobile element protein [Brockia lithotrophica]
MLVVLFVGLAYLIYSAIFSFGRSDGLFGGAQANSQGPPTPRPSEGGGVSETSGVVEVHPYEHDVVRPGTMVEILYRLPPERVSGDTIDLSGFTFVLDEEQVLPFADVFLTSTQPPLATFRVKLPDRLAPGLHTACFRSNSSGGKLSYPDDQFCWVIQIGR